MTRTFLAAFILISAVPQVKADVSDWFPESTAYVVRFNIKAMIGQPVVGDASAVKSALGEATNILEQCGVDPTRDLERATLAIGSDASSRTAALFVEGAIDAAKINAKLLEMTKDPQKRIESRPGNIFLWTLPKDMAAAATDTIALPNRFLIAVPRNNLAVLALDDSALADATEKIAGKKRGIQNPNLLKMIQSPKSAQALELTAIPPAGALGRGPASGMTQLTGGISIKDSVKLDLFCMTRDASAAKSLAEFISDGAATIKAFVVLAAAQSKTTTPKQQEMIRELFDTFRATATANGVAIQSTLSREFLERNSKR